MKVPSYLWAFSNFGMRVIDTHIHSVSQKYWASSSFQCLYPFQSSSDISITHPHTHPLPTLFLLPLLSFVPLTIFPLHPPYSPTFPSPPKYFSAFSTGHFHVSHCRCCCGCSDKCTWFRDYPVLVPPLFPTTQVYLVKHVL